MHMKLVSVFLFNFQAEVLVSVRENFDFQPACLSEFEYETNVETGKLECFEIASWIWTFLYCSKAKQTNFDIPHMFGYKLIPKTNKRACF